MLSPRMTMDEVLEDMRAHGMKMSKALLTECFVQEIFPFCRNVKLPSGSNNFIIMRRDYNEWASVYLTQEVGMAQNG